MALTPWSSDARMASTASPSSLPPHIHPPIAQAPKMTGETRTSDEPSCRSCMAGKVTQRAPACHPVDVRAGSCGRQLPHSLDVAHRRLAEVALVVAAEM